MANNINCTCGHSWSKESSSGKDMNVCHICGKDNTMKNGGWLNKYEQGGMVLKQKTHDNYDLKGNPNDVQASVGPGYVGLGYNTKGRNYSPAWGGQFQDGGEIPQAQNGWLEKLTSTLNPYNWRVEDYSKEKDFTKAYSTAKKAGEEEFMYKGKRYNTKYAGTPRQEVGTYGVDGKPVHPIDLNHPAQVNLYPAFGKYLPGHISASVGDNETSIDYSSRGNFPFGINEVKNKGEKSFNVYGQDNLTFSNKAASLPTGDYMLEDKYTPSDWNLFTNNCADNVCDAFGIPRSKGIQTPSGAVSKIKKKYPTLDITGKAYEDYYDLSEKLQSSFPEKILPQAKNILGIASSPDLKKLKPKFISSIQQALYESGYELPKSKLKNNNNFDGVLGDETKAALLDWQKKNKSLAMGGALPGAVGFTYARTQNPAPSNGKYAKKTKASAQDGLLMNFEPEKMRSDATRVAPAVRPLTKKEQEENARINKENQKKTEERDKKIVAERQANKNTKGDLSTPGSWHTADKLRLFPSSVGGVGEMFDEYVNPAYVVGSLTDQLGESVARRDIGGAAATLAMTAGLGALGVDPLGDVMKAQRWSQGAVDRLGYNVQTAGPRLGSSTRSLESATAAERSQQQLDLIRQQRRSEAVSRGSQSTRAPYQFPTDEELAIMNAREAERYAPRVSRQSTGTPEDMTALDRFERIQQVDPGPSYAELMEYPSARRVDSQAESAQQAAMNDIRRETNFPVDATNPNSVVHSNNPTLTYERLNRRIDALRTSGISDDIIAQDVQYLREGRPMRSLSQLRGAPGSVPRPPEVRTGPTEKQWSPENFRIGEGNDAGKFRTAHPEGHNIYEDIDISPINNSIDRRYKIVDKDKSMNYVEVKTSQDAGDPYVDVNDISFFNRDPNSSSKQMNIVFSHLPKQARISPISTSVHSQPLLNTRIAKLTSGQPGRIKIEPNEYMGTLNKITRNEGFSPLAWYDETVEQFPKLERTYETLNKYTGSNLQMPYIKFQGQKLPFEEFNTPEFRRLVENNPSLLGDADVMVNKYKTIKNWKNGGQIVDSMGQWAHPGKTTTIPGNDITMKGVNYDVLGVSNTGDKKLMKPGKNYKFDGDYVTEYPKGGWLNKYK